MIVLIVIVFVVLVIVRAVRPRDSIYSAYEYARRAKQNESELDREALRHATYHDAQMWLGLKEMILMIALTLSLTAVYGAGLGIVYAVCMLLAYQLIARLPLVQRITQELYDAHEEVILAATQKLRPVARLLYAAPPARERDIASREELEHTVEQANRFFDDVEQGLLASAFNFSDKTVGQYMTPRDEVETIDVGELLGPLVLDDLHKTGHSQFPVIEGDLDHVVGILSVDRFLAVRDHQSSRVKDVMSAQVAYVHEDESLQAACAVFLAAKQHLLVVIDDQQRTVGLLSLDDVLRELLGSEVVSEFDAHQDKTAVAARAER